MAELSYDMNLQHFKSLRLDVSNCGSYHLNASAIAFLDGYMCGLIQALNAYFQNFCGGNFKGLLIVVEDTSILHTI